MFRGIDKFRKMICLALSVALIAVQSGCYSVKVAGSIETLDPHLLSIKKGDTVSIIYYENENVYVIQGRIKEILSDEIVLITGSISEKNIPFDNIRKINISLCAYITETTGSLKIESNREGEGALYHV